MKIFIVGGAGFVGSNFIKKFHNYYEIILCQSSENEELSKFCIKNNIIVEKCKIQDSKIIDLILNHKPEIVLHLATFGNLKKCETYQNEAFDVNVLGTRNILTACKKLNSRIIYLSSREVYGNTNSNSSLETDPLLPNNILGFTKMLSESLILEFNEKFKLDYTIFRPSNIYGIEKGKFVVARMIKSALEKNKIEVFGGNQEINLVHINDVLHCINFTIKNPQVVRNQIFNIGSSNNVTILDLAKKIQNHILNKQISIEILDSRTGETTFFKPNIEKSKKFFNFEPQTDLDVGIKEITSELDNT